MRKILLLFVLVFVVMSGQVFAGDFYLYETDQYWWFVDQSPDYEILVPAKGEAYLDSQRFGEKRLQITLEKNGPVLTVGSLNGTGTSVESIEKSLVDGWKYLFLNMRVIANETITTSAGQKGKFHAVRADVPNGGKALLRTVVFSKGKDRVYLAYLTTEKAYQGDVREYWIRAVNTFKWR